MKRFVTFALLVSLAICSNENPCHSIEAWTNDAAGKDIKLMESGLITKEFDRRITTQPKLYYLDEN
jgi:hypothetical protein